MQNIEKEKNSWLKLSIILGIIFSLGAATALSSGGNMQINLDDQQAIALMKILQAIGVVIIFIAPAVLFAVFWTKAGISYLGVTKLPSLRTTLIAGAGMVLALPLIDGLSELNQLMHLPASLQGIETWMKNSEDNATEITKAFTQGTSVGTLILNLFVIAFMAGISEELFFRGVLQKVLIECFKNKHAGVWIGAILFSAFHMQFYGFLPRMLMGAYLGYLFVWTGSIWPGVIAHFLNNGLAVYVSWLMNRGVIANDPEQLAKDPQQWGYVAISAALVIFSMILVYRMERKRRLEETEAASILQIDNL